jgi:hypothetical protein
MGFGQLRIVFYETGKIASRILAIRPIGDSERRDTFRGLLGREEGGNGQEHAASIPYKSKLSDSSATRP